MNISLNVNRANAVQPTVAADATISGVVRNHPHSLGPGGEVQPGGSYLHLTHPVSIAGQLVTEIKLPRSFAEGAELLAQGKIIARRWGGVSTPGGVYFELDAGAVIDNNARLVPAGPAQVKRS